MRFSIRAFLLTVTFSLAAFAQDPLLDIQSHANSILSDITQEQAQVAGLNATITQQTNQIQQDQQTIAQDGATIAADAQQITALQGQLAAASAAQGMTSSFLTQLAQAQTLSNWVLAGGSAGNTGQKGSTGSGTFTPNPDGTATITIAPNGPYYDSFWWRKAAGTIAPVLNDFDYHAEFRIDAANMPLSQQIELESSWYQGTYRFQCAAAIEMHSKSLRYYDPAKGWVATGILANPVPGQWEPIELLCHSDPATGNETFLGVYLEGKYHPLNITVHANQKPTTSPWLHTSVQLDSNSAGKPYQADVRNIGLGWL